MMSVYEALIDRKSTLAVVGLGYVGLPLAVAFAKKVGVIGFDINAARIADYRKGIDPTGEIGGETVKKSGIRFTCDQEELKQAKFLIIAVPTPINADKTPDLRPVVGASEIVGRNLSKGSIVVYESTVYPGLTEEICIPLLENMSGMKCGIDFKVGYSPERINPGDKVHTVSKITKIVSGIDLETLEEISSVYALIVEAGVYKAESIKVAEAAKVIENTQRDINIAFMNELSVIFNKMNIDTYAVLKAAGTKWNFLNFTPGLVGGHCIGVDPYYLTYKAEQIGYHPQVILAGRRINDGMGKHIAENTIKQLIRADKPIKGARVLILGLTFKENVPDTRNTRVIDIYNELLEYGVEVFIADPVADRKEAHHEYGIRLIDNDKMVDMDAVILAVAHDIFKGMGLSDIDQMYGNGTKVFIDVKGVYDKNEAEAKGFLYWRL